MGEGIAELLVNIHGEAGAVKTAGSAAAPLITGTEMLFGFLENAAAVAGCFTTTNTALKVEATAENVLKLVKPAS